MEIKDQLRIRMEELKIPISELARRCGVSPQSVRFWLQGRSYPGKAKTALVESALSFKMDFSSDNTASNTVEETLRKTDIETFILIQQMPDQLKMSFNKMAQEIVRLSQSREPVSVGYGPGRSLADVHGYPTPDTVLRRV